MTMPTALSGFEPRGDIVMNADHDIKTLNDLLVATIDSVEGYREAAKETESSHYADMFQRRATERDAIIRDLHATVLALGGKPDDVGTVLAAMQRKFVDLKGSMGKVDDKAIVDYVEDLEDRTKAKFEDALEDTELSPGVQADVQRGLISVRNGHDEISGLKHSLEQRE
jgi:uncharacterized protein (TIGR02284 family)